MHPSEEKDFQEAIKAIHRCDAKHVESMRVHKVFRGKAAWKGFVEVLDLAGHPKAKRCYAWRYLDGKMWRCTTVLEILPVDSPETAVKVAIAAKAKKK